MSRFLRVIAAGSIVVATASTGWSQIAGGPQGFGGQGFGGQGFGGAQGVGGAQGAAGAQGFGPGQGIPSFSPVTGAQAMGGGMSAQQQMAQIYMLYGMLGGRGNVSTGVANPFANGGYGMGSLPSLDSQVPYDNSASAVRGSASARKAEMRAQRAEEKRQAKLAKAKPAPTKPARKKNEPIEQ